MIAGHGRRRATLAVEQGDLAEELARAEDIEDQFLAIEGVHCERDAACHDAIKAIARVALLEEDASCRNASTTRMFQQFLLVLRRQVGEEAMKAKQVLSRHSRTTVKTGSCGQSGDLRQSAQERRSASCC